MSLSKRLMMEAGVFTHPFAEKLAAQETDEESVKAEEASVPKLYATEEVPLKEKIIHEHWVLPSCNFHWLIAEYDPEQKLAFGYANLNDNQNAEWGYISIAELEQAGAEKVKGFKPTKFSEIIGSIEGAPK